MPATVLIRENE